MQELRAASFDVLEAAPLFWAGPLLRPWHEHWGATADEAAATLSGDDLVPGAQFNVTRAIAALPESVWPWIAQIGFRRAGVYSYHLFHNLGQPSACNLPPDDGHLSVWASHGDEILATFGAVAGRQA